jgi:N-acyl-D-amino-acid deacylase
MAPISLLIHDGEVVDGTGSPGYRAAIAVEDGRLRVLRGDVDAVAADLRIDAAGKVVAPGFIDAHSHSALVVLEEPALEGKLLQGVTSEVVGIDGLSYTPFADRDDLQAFVAINSGIDGDPDVGYDWRDLPGYFARVDGRISPNIASFVGNTSLRISALGWRDAPSTPESTAVQARLLEAEMEAGALGLSTGLDYPPGSYASTEELIGLARVVSRYGGVYHTHVRYSLGDAYLDPFREAIEICRPSGCALHVTHFARSSRGPYTGGARPMIELLERAREDGIDVTFDTYPYEWGGTRLMRLLPAWVQADGPGPLCDRLRDPAVRERLRREVEAGGAYRAYETSRPFADVRMTHFKRPENEALDGRFLGEVAADTQRHVVDVIADLLLSEDLRVTFTRPSPQATTLPAFVIHPLSMVGTDGVMIGRFASPRAFGSFARILGDYVREERILSMPDAIRRMTSFPATRFGLRGRGTLADGQAADIVVFDPATVRAQATWEQPRATPVGITHVVVNGTLVVSEGRHTGATPGRALPRGVSI